METVELLDYISQVGIFIFGATAVYLLTRKDKWTRWGHIAGWLSQPFFLYTAYVNGQIGVFLLAIFYWIQWTKGIYNYFYKEE
jgi:hypothetical protein